MRGRSRAGRQGHCRAIGQLHNCQLPPPPSSSLRGRPLSIEESIIGTAQCPNLHASARPAGPLDLPPGAEYLDGYGYEYGSENLEFPGQDVVVVEEDEEYIVVEGPSVEVLGPDEFFEPENVAPEFRAVATPRELQLALRDGTYHILITAHLDMTGVTPEMDLQQLEALDNAVGRVLNTTLTITVRTSAAMIARSIRVYVLSSNTGLCWATWPQRILCGTDLRDSNIPVVLTTWR